jgi:hypothetical protein
VTGALYMSRGAPTVDAHMTLGHRNTAAAVIDIWNGSTTPGLELFLAPGYRGHVLGAPSGERDAASYAEAISRFRAANPGVVFRVVEQFDAGDRLVSRLEASRPATHQDAASASEGINISRFDDDGRLAEEWAIWSAWRTT